MPTVHEQLSKQFYEWESRGRGWQVFAEPVQPEPPFRPFNGYRLAEVVDDGRRPTVFSSLFRKFTQPQPEPVVEEAEEEPEPIPLTRDVLTEFQASLPADLDVSRESFDQFLRNLDLSREPLAFELIGTHQRVYAQFAACADDAVAVGNQLAAHFPDVTFRQLQDGLTKAWDASMGDQAFAIELGLQREFMLPLATGKQDAFVGIIGALAGLRPDELAVFQILWQSVQNPWGESLVNSVTMPDGKPLFVNASELVGAAENKAAKPLYAAVVRIMARTTTRSRLEEIARVMASSLRVYSNPVGNVLIPLDNKAYPYEEHLEDVLRRQSRRSGMLLCGEELVGFVHLPSNAVRLPALVRDAGLTKAAPDFVRQAPGLVIGDNEHNGDTVPVYLTANQRVRHTHIIGSSGTGKSSLLFNLIRQDIDNGEGVGVLDPHGDLIDQILGVIPDDRIDDVVLVDPSDVDFPIGFNILSAHSEDEKNLLASDLIAVFRRLSTSWGDQMDTVLQNAILAFLHSREGGTLSDLRLFLLDEKATGFKKHFLETVTDDEVVFFWRNVYPKLTGGKSVGPVLTRLQDFFSRKPLRNMIGQPKNRLDFADIMDSGKIFLARLPEGFGEENSYLLGTLLISKFQQLAMARHSQKAESRRDFWLYVDEFDHFITPSMAKILSAVRKYRLGFTLAHQGLHQLQSDPTVASAVLTQPCTRIVFKVGDDDAKKLADGFESFDAKSIKNLPKFRALARVEQNDGDFNLALRKPELPEEAEANEQRDKCFAASRARYATPRGEVEASLLLRVWGANPSPPPPPAPVVVPLPKVELPTAAVVTPPPATEALPDKGSENISANEATATVAPVVIPPALSKPKLVTPETKLTKEQGRGFAWHQSVQKRIKTEGQKLGFNAESEKQLAKGSMQAADVVLIRGHINIAVEIASASSNINHEFDNIQKCLNAGFSQVAAIASGRKFLNGLMAAVQGALGPERSAKVSYFTPDEFIDEMRRLAAASELPPPAQPLAAKDVRGGFEIERTFPQPNPDTQQGIHDIVGQILSKPSPKSGSS